jgi:hypothetical protein
VEQATTAACGSRGPRIETARSTGAGSTRIEEEEPVVALAVAAGGAARLWLTMAGVEQLACGSRRSQWSRAEALLVVLELELGPTVADRRGHGSVELMAVTTMASLSHPEISNFKM